MMFEQGSSNPFDTRVRMLVTSTACLMIAAALSSNLAAQELEIRIRATWLSTATEPFRGTIGIDEGSLAELQNLSLHAGSTGAFDLSNDRKSITIDMRSVSDRGGLEFLVRGKATSNISFEKPDMQTSPAKPANVALRDLLSSSGKQIDVLDGKVQLSLTRSPGDMLRAKFDRSVLVFRPEESIPLTIEAIATGIPTGTNLTLSMALSAARVDEPIVERSWDVVVNESGGIDAIDAGPLKIPDAESAYDLHLSLSAEKKYLNVGVPWAPNETIVSRMVQFAVVSDVAPVNDSRPFIEIARIDPGKREWWNPTWIPNSLRPEQLIPESIPSIVPQRRVPVSSEPIRQVPWNGLQVTELAARGWQAYPLEIVEQGKPHMLVVRYPSDRPMRLGVSLLEPNAAGKVVPLGIDTGVAVAPQAIAPTTELLEHRVVFWPKTRRSMVVLTNFDSSAAAWFANISVEAGPINLPVALESEPNASSAKNQRLASLYLDKPLLADTFGCTKSFDPTTGQAIEDWRTFMEAGQRMVQYLKWAGFNSAIITVSCEGGTLYPTDLMSSTLRYDTGLLSSTGNDPSKKDVLEVLFRIFDRSGLKLIPAVELSTPLTVLERELRHGQSPTGLEPINSTGHRYIDVNRPEHGLAPFYNPLDARVQSAVSDIVLELNKRYQNHPSFAGIGLHLGGQTYVQMPGVDWGFDRKTLNSFASSLASPLTAPNQLIRWIETDGRGQFLAWRGRKLAELYGQMAQKAGDRPLLLLTADWASTDSGRAFDSERQAIEAGIDWESLGGLQDVIPMRLHRAQPLADHALRAMNAQIANSELWDSRLSALPSSGAMVVRPPSDVRLEAFEQQSPWRPEDTTAWLFAHGVPSGDDSRRDLAKVLLRNDVRIMALGGWTVPRGAELSTQEFLTTFSQLPAGRFEDVQIADSGSPQLAIVRRLRTADEFYFYAVNPAPWATQVKVEMSNPEKGSITRIGPDKKQTIQSREISETLGPGEIAAYRIASNQADIVTWRSEIPGMVALSDHLGEQMKRLAQKIGKLAQPTPYAGLSNAKFDDPVSSNGGTPGWLAAQHPVDGVKLVAGAGFNGSQAICLTDRGETNAKTWLLSHPFNPPTSGRLAVHLRVRRGVDSEGARLQIAIEGRYRNRSFRRSMTIGEEDTISPNVDWTGTSHRFEVTDLPIEGLEELRLAFDLTSPGKIFIDEVQLFDQFLTDAERADLQSQVFVAVEGMHEGDFSACGKLIDSYWGRHLLGLPVAETPSAIPTTPSPAIEEKQPSIADRLRQWLPAPIWR